MRRRPILASAVLVLLAGCGSSSHNSAVTIPPPTTPARTVTITSPGTASTPVGTGGTGATGRTEPAPTTATPAGGGGLGGAVAVVTNHGFVPNSTTTYQPGDTLRVLVATRKGSADGYSQQAFFFSGDRYLGTDLSSQSAGISYVSQDDTTVTLRYATYSKTAALCCPTGHATVRYQLNDGKLVPLDPIPPASERG